MTTGLDLGLADHRLAMAAMDRNRWAFSGLSLDAQRNLFADLYEQVTADYDLLCERYDLPAAVETIRQAQQDWSAWAELPRQMVNAAEGQRIARSLYELGFSSPEVCDTLRTSLYDLYTVVAPQMANRLGIAKMIEVEAALLAGDSCSKIARRFNCHHMSIIRMADHMGIPRQLPEHVWAYALDLASWKTIRQAVDETKARFGREATRLTTGSLQTRRHRERTAVFA